MNLPAKYTSLNVFIAVNEPETCRNCGARTEFEEVSPQQQVHECGGCGIQYLLEFESAASWHKSFKL